MVRLRIQGNIDESVYERIMLWHKKRISGQLTPLFEAKNPRDQHGFSASLEVLLMQGFEYQRLAAKTKKAAKAGNTV